MIMISDPVSMIVRTRWNVHDLRLFKLDNIRFGGGLARRFRMVELLTELSPRGSSASDLLTF